MRFGALVRVEDLDERALLGLADALEVEHFAEVGFAGVGDVQEVRSHERFGRRRVDLERLEERDHARERLRGTFDEGGRRKRGWLGEGEEVGRGCRQSCEIEVELQDYVSRM